MSISKKGLTSSADQGHFHHFYFFDSFFLFLCFFFHFAGGWSQVMVAHRASTISERSSKAAHESQRRGPTLLGRPSSSKSKPNAHQIRVRVALPIASEDLGEASRFANSVQFNLRKMLTSSNISSLPRNVLCGIKVN